MKFIDAEAAHHAYLSMLLLPLCQIKVQLPDIYKKNKYTGTARILSNQSACSLEMQISKRMGFASKKHAIKAESNIMNNSLPVPDI